MNARRGHCRVHGKPELSWVMPERRSVLAGCTPTSAPFHVMKPRRLLAAIPMEIRMKIAEALVLRADHQRRIEQLKARLLRNAKVQEGEQPAEDPETLILEYEALASELVHLIKRINISNSSASVAGRSMTQALAERDILKLRHSMYRDLAQAATITQSVATRSEIRFRGTVTVSAVQKKADLIAKDLRELDARIQEANWLIDLAE